jgi:protein involved in polysaccharide export with SLBB domain
MRTFIIIMLCIVALGYSQDMTKAARNLFDLESTLRKSDLQPLPDTPVLDRPVEAHAYLLGPGDVLSVVIISTTEFHYQVAVDVEGQAIIPNLGGIPVSGLSLADAREKIVQAIRTRYLGKEIYVGLQKLRTFRVAVTGAVEKPGLVTVNAVQRVSDAIFQAGGLKKKLSVMSQTQEVQVETPSRSEYSVQTSQTRADALLNQAEASMRNIQIRRGQATIRADLIKFQLTGDVDANPYVTNGDVIFVPTRENDVAQISIRGAVKADADYEYAPGDRVCDLLKMAHGFTADADTTFMEVVRFTDVGSTAKTIRLDLNDRTNYKFPLLPDDRLYVRSLPKFHEESNIEIVGEVKYPGNYAIGLKETHLTELIGKAGGFTSEASLKNAYIVRRADEDLRDPEFERLKKMNVAEMTQSEREYFKIKSRERIGGMGVDFVALFEGKDKTQDVLLRDRDLIVIPAQEQTIKITGQVVNPGLYIYKPGRTLSYYLKEAGGYNWNARTGKVRVIKSKTGEWMKPNDNSIIEVGDTIFIPEKPERDWWLIAKDLITVAAQMATIYLVVDRSTR